jgi:hypothetical protein
MAPLMRHRQRELLAKAQLEPTRYRVIDLHSRQIYPVCLDQGSREVLLEHEESIDDF